MSDDRPPPPIEHLDKPTYWERRFAAPSTGAGMQRFVWDLREAPPRSLQPDLPISAVPRDTPRVPEGVLVVPGRYTVRLDVDGRTIERPLVIAMDPRVAISRGALERQYALGREIAAIVNRSYDENAAATRGGHASAAEAFATLNADAQSLLDTVEGADAPPTLQAAEAVRLLEGRLAATQNR